MKKFKCKVCGYIHEGNTAPEICPVCGAPASEFEEIKSGIDTNSNVYTIIYSIILVIVVALLLAFASGALKEKQTANIALDKKKQILSTLNIDTQGKDANALYNQYITAGEIINTKAEVLSNNRNAVFSLDIVKEGAKPENERQLPVYIAEVDGDTKYIFPVRGAGLWGAIWGYVALNSDKNSIFGVYYSHASETPGLGAEITSEHFKQQFKNKHILDATGKFVSVAVMKAGQTAAGQDQVDAIAGGTITSKGLENMLFNSIGQYTEYLKPAVQAELNEAESINQSQEEVQK